MAIYYVTLLSGLVLVILGLSNSSKKAQKHEKTSVGKVEDFYLLGSEKSSVPLKYHADIKAGNKKYEIEGYSMPWLNKGEEVKIQITGKQKILGNKRLDRKGKTELAFGFLLLMYPVAMYLSYIFR